MMMKKRLMKMIAPLMCTTILFACGNNDDSVSITSTNTSNGVNIDTLSTIGDSDVQTVVSELTTYRDEDFYTDWENENPTYITLAGEQQRLL